MSTWFKFWRKPENTAQVAKDRLQMIVSRERTACGIGAPGFLPALQQELLQVIAKYDRVDLDHVQVSIDRRGEAEVLELSVMLPEPEQKSERARPSVRSGILYA
ncbi:MAG TPA: cell division topological specificity factor MinE [Polyangiaceae bacterium]|nr:cell division topological specificity factor MinE [Polyangiaceae bacterium]